MFCARNWILTSHRSDLFVLAADSVSSVEMNSSFQRVQPSPFRLVASPRSTSNNSRFSMSQSPRPTRLTAVNLNFDQIVQATRNFSSSMKIGKGAFGIVYKGELEDRHMVAIKRVKTVGGIYSWYPYTVLGAIGTFVKSYVY